MCCTRRATEEKKQNKTKKTNEKHEGKLHATEHVWFNIEKFKIMSKTKANKQVEATPPLEIACFFSAGCRAGERKAQFADRWENIKGASVLFIYCKHQWNITQARGRLRIHRWRLTKKINSVVCLTSWVSSYPHCHNFNLISLAETSLFLLQPLHHHPSLSRRPSKLSAGSYSIRFLPATPHQNHLSPWPSFSLLCRWYLAVPQHLHIFSSPSTVCC